MAFPTVQSRTETAVHPQSTTHDISMPATVDAGDLLLMFVAIFDPDSGTPTFTTPTGWTSIFDVANASNRSRHALFGKDADGTEDSTTVNVATNVTCVMAAVVYRITDWGGTLGSHVEASSSPSTGNSSSPDPPAVTPTGGADDYLWIPSIGAYDDNISATSAPTDYTNLIDVLTGGGGNQSAQVYTAERQLNASTENPGTFSISSNESYAGMTTVVHPAAAGGGLSIPVAMASYRQRHQSVV